MGFTIIKRNGNTYRKNINKTGMCKYYPDLKCVCCNQECDHNISIDDELEEELMNKLEEFLYS